MPDISPIDQEIASIRAKHDKHDYSQALGEVQQDFSKHSKNAAEQTEFEHKLVASGLIGDLALEWGRDRLAHNGVGLANRQQIEATEQSDNPVDRLMATQLDRNWDRLSSESGVMHFISTRQLTEELERSSTISDAKALTEPFRTDPALFDKLKNNGAGSGLIFTHDNEITTESLTAAAKPDSPGLTDQQRKIAQNLLDNFDGAGLRSIENGNYFTGRGITREALDTFLKSNPDDSTPAAAVTAQVDSNVGPPRNAPPTELPPPGPIPAPVPVPEGPVQRTTAVAPVEPPPASPPPRERPPGAPPPPPERPPGTTPSPPERPPVATPPPPPREVSGAPHTAPAGGQDSATTAALPPKDSDEGKAIRTAPVPPGAPQPEAPFSNKLNAGEGPYQSFRSAHPNWTHQQALDAAHAVKNQLGRELFRQGEQFRTNADGSVTSRLEDHRHPGLYTETTGKDGHTTAVKSGDANGNWTNTTFDASGKPTGSTEHKVTADGWTETVNGADGKPTGATVHKKNADGSLDDAKLDKDGKVTEQSHINPDGSSIKKTANADGTNVTEMHFDKDGHETGSRQFTKNADGSNDLTAFDRDEKAVANHHVNADGSMVDRQFDPNNPNVYKETKSDKDGKLISESEVDAAGNHRGMVKNPDNSTTYTVESADKTTMFKIDAAGKFVESTETINQTHITIDVAFKDGKWVKTTHTPGKPDTIENVEEPTVPQALRPNGS